MHSIPSNAPDFSIFHCSRESWWSWESSESWESWRSFTQGIGRLGGSPGLGKPVTLVQSARVNSPRHSELLVVTIALAFRKPALAF